MICISGSDWVMCSASLSATKELDRQKLQIGKQLGSGYFSVVYEGNLQDEKDNAKRVAVKLLKGRWDQSFFLVLNGWLTIFP